MNSNDKTLKSYEENIQAYADGTAPVTNGEFAEWLDTVVARVPKDARILEIGSAVGRDADYIEAKGYTVERSDATQGFVDLQKSNGHEVRLLNVLKDDIDAEYDLILALAVLLHFNEAETDIALANIYNALSPGGIFGFVTKQGEGEEWSSHKLNAPRYFHFWSQDYARQLMDKHGFEVVELSTAENDKWILVTAQKR